jgi:hypothetical protein
MTTSSRTFTIARDLNGNVCVTLLDVQPVTFKATQYIQLESNFKVGQGVAFEIINES